MDRNLEQRYLKDLVPENAKTPQELAPEPVLLVFKSWSLNIIEGMDPVSGTRIITLVFTSGNFALQFQVLANTLQIATLVRALQEKLGVQNGDNPSSSSPA